MELCCPCTGSLQLRAENPGPNVPKQTANTRTRTNAANPALVVLAWVQSAPWPLGGSVEPDSSACRPPQVRQVLVFSGSTCSSLSLLQNLLLDGCNIIEESPVGGREDEAQIHF